LSSAFFIASSISFVRRMIHTGLPRHSTICSSPGASLEMSASTGAPAALARSEGHQLQAKGTATAAPAAALTAPVAISRFRRDLSILGVLMSGFGDGGVERKRDFIGMARESPRFLS
jgi:hypothetical protein